MGQVSIAPGREPRSASSIHGTAWPEAVVPAWNPLVLGDCGHAGWAGCRSGAGPDSWRDCGAGVRAVGTRRAAPLEEPSACCCRRAGGGHLVRMGSQGSRDEMGRLPPNQPFSDRDQNKRMDQIPDAQIRLADFLLYKHTEDYQVSCYCFAIQQKGTCHSTFLKTS